MIRFRSFRNDDPPELVDLWNRGLPAYGAVTPLSVHEFDALVVGRLGFDHEGLIIAESEEGQVIGFVHAGFGPAEPAGPSHRLDHQLGTIAMLLVDPDRGDEALEQGLVREALGYLRQRGTQVFYAGGQSPLNPFYWGLYGCSEYSGVLAQHAVFERAVLRAGFEPISSTILFEAELDRLDPLDPRLMILRRQVRFEISEDTMPAGWWQALAIGLFRPTRFQLFRRADNREIAAATTWEIASGFGLGDGRSRVGLIDLEVHPEFRRKSFGRLLVTEIGRHARSQLAEVLCVQSSDVNTAAIGLYQSLGFSRITSATTFRLPA